MKIRSLLLGSIAAAGLATTGFAADLGVVTSLDVCDELGLSGLTISSDTNCLQISGGVSFEYSAGDYAPGAVLLSFDRSGGTKTIIDNDGTTDATLDIDAWLQFVGTADSDFGPASATIKLLSEDNNGKDDWVLDTEQSDEWEVLVDKAWVGIGDTTMLMAGKKSSIFNDGDDAPLNYLGLFNSSDVDVGVGFSGAVDRNGDGDTLDAGEGGAGATTGGAVIQLVHNLGNGLSIGGGVENLQTSSPIIATAVGVIAYAGDGIGAHLSGAVDQAGDWKTHAGFTGTWDPIKVVGAISANSDKNGGPIWWNALGSVEASFDMFKLALSGEATSGDEWGVGASVGATVSEGVTINLGGRYFTDTSGGPTGYQVEAGVSAAVTEAITLTAAVGATDSDVLPGSAVFYGKAGLAWAPGGGFTSSISGEANTLGGYKATFKAAKDFN